VRDQPYGVLGQFEAPEDLVRATAAVREEGYEKFEAYTPFPIEEMPQALGFKPTPVAWIMFAGGVTGAISGYLLQFYVAVIAYPINVGGRPLNSWQSFVPVVFEMTVLFAALSGLVGMLWLNGLPLPHHPLFGVPAFERATRDGFFLCLESSDPRFDEDSARRLLQRLGAHDVVVVADD